MRAGAINWTEAKSHDTETRWEENLYVAVNLGVPLEQHDRRRQW